MSDRAEKNLLKRIVDSLKTLKDQGLSNRAVGEKIGVTENTIKNWIDGKTSPSAIQLQKIAELAGKNTAWFYGESDVSLKVAEPKAPYGSDELAMMRGQIRAMESEIQWYRSRVEDALGRCSRRSKNNHNSNTRSHTGG